MEEKAKKTNVDDLRFTLKHMGWAIVTTMLVVGLLSEFRTVQAVQAQNELNNIQRFDEAKEHANEVSEITKKFLLERINIVDGRVTKKSTQNKEYFQNELHIINGIIEKHHGVRDRD